MTVWTKNLMTLGKISISMRINKMKMIKETYRYCASPLTGWNSKWNKKNMNHVTGKELGHHTQCTNTWGIQQKHMRVQIWSIFSGWHKQDKTNYIWKWVMFRTSGKVLSGNACQSKRTWTCKSQNQQKEWLFKRWQDCRKCCREQKECSKKGYWEWELRGREMNRGMRHINIENQ